jgi:hypothetical protein
MNDELSIRDKLYNLITNRRLTTPDKYPLMSTVMDRLISQLWLKRESMKTTINNKDIQS